MKPTQMTPAELERQVFKAFPPGSLERTLVASGDAERDEREEAHEEELANLRFDHDEAEERWAKERAAFEEQVEELQAELQEEQARLALANEVLAELEAQLTNARA